jgi:hypothetical protein
MFLHWVMEELGSALLSRKIPKQKRPLRCRRSSWSHRGLRRKSVTPVRDIYYRDDTFFPHPTDFFSIFRTGLTSLLNKQDESDDFDKSKPAGP